MGMMLVHAEDETVQLDLKPASSGAGVIELELTDRFQGLPIKWRLNGEPGESFVLPPLENLRFEGLREGLWRRGRSKRLRRASRARCRRPGQRGLDPRRQGVPPVRKAGVKRGHSNRWVCVQKRRNEYVGITMN